MAAQTPAVDTTIDQARDLHLAGQLRQAEKLLGRWCADHPTDTTALWLRGQNDYWRKNFRRSRRHYRSALDLDPGNFYLQLDFADSQLGMGRFRAAGKLLRPTSKTDRKNPYYLYLLAKQLYWTGDVKAAEKHARAAEKAGSKEAADLVREIERTRSPWGQLAATYTTDSQPLESYESGFSAGYFRSKWWDVHFRAGGQRFLNTPLILDALRFELGNRVYFPKTGTELAAAAGIFQLKNQKAQPLVHLELAQRLPFGWKLQLGAAQQPYFHTRSSLSPSLIFQQWSASLEWREAHGFWLKAGGQNNHFADRNQIVTGWGWAMTPALKVGWASGRLGYSYSWSDATENRFIADKTLAELLTSWDPTAQVRGHYAPYFTPQAMEMHMALVILQFDFLKYITLTINGKYGFSASASNPYVYLDKDATDVAYIRRDFQKTNFTPLEMGAKLAVRFSEVLSGEADYTFARTFFYELQSTGLRLKMRF